MQYTKKKNEEKKNETHAHVFVYKLSKIIATRKNENCKNAKKNQHGKFIRQIILNTLFFINITFIDIYRLKFLEM